MTRNDIIARAVRRALVMSAVVVASAAGTPAFAQDQDTETTTVVVTGSRIIRQDYEANSPITTVSKDALTHNADITLETALNNLPQIVAGGTTTSNNPPNNGQANIDLRGLGPNRNLVLVDGRRPMVSANDLTVDVNTIPAALIDSIEVITGGAGAVYGADAVAGVVNMKLKHNFEGFNLSTSYSDSTEHHDSEEYNISALLGGNFADGKGNAVFGFDRTSRESLLKSQRQFALLATGTTSNPPQGVLRWNTPGTAGNGTNPVSQAAVNAVFAKYGVAAGKAQNSPTKIGFNQDGTLFAVGTFNSPLDVQHFTDPIDQGVNSRFYPDFYSFNFDPLNLLTLPLNRNSFMTDLHYEVGGGVEVFGQGSWTQYTAATGLAPSPVPGVTFASPDRANPASEVSSALINAGSTCNTSGGGKGRCSFSSGIPVPVTNPFVQALPDLMQLLNSRTGDDLRLVGQGANEPFLASFRPVDAGLRQENFQNTVIQYMGGVRGPILTSGWRFEAYFSEGRTQIDDRQQGNINTQKVTDLLGAADGGKSQCAGGFNIFGAHKLSQECLALVKVTTATTLTMRQRIGQAFVTGDIFDMPAGALSSVFGVEYRGFDYTFDPGANAGPISGFGTSDPEQGSNNFKDIFTEFSIPLLKDAPFVKSLDLDVAYRHSRSEFTDELSGVSSAAQTNSTYKADISWQPIDALRVRTSYQRAVRAPNFSELFQGGSSFPQIFDPCSSNGVARTGPNAAKMRALCLATGLSPSNVDTFVGTPGGQAEIDTGGNATLKPEKADSYTLGFVFTVPTESRWTEKLRSSVDYYKIKVKDAILVPDPNVGIAACYNYFGTNPTYDPNYAYCSGIARGPDIQAIGDVNAPDQFTFAGLNGGTIDTSGIDFQVDWGFDADMVGMPANWGGVTMNLIVSKLLDYKLQDTPGVPSVDYAGTVNYFGGGISLGQTFPDIRAVLNTQWNVGKFSLAVRGRYIDKMDNRAQVQFAGETAFKGVGSVTYWDAAVSWRFMEKSELRIGLNNAFDKQPPTYAPNVQSGTDPATYDIIGRRAFARFEVQF